MRAWRTPSGFIADLGPTSAPVLSSQEAQLPEGPWRELHEYAAIDADGTVRERYRVSVWSLEDDLGISTHAVIGGELRSLTLVETYGKRISREEQTVMAGLLEMADTAFVQDAIARQGRREKEAIQKSRAAAEVRVAAIPGGVEDFNLGDSFRRAQLLLVERIKAYDDKLSAELLETLALFGRLHQTGGGDGALTAALDAFVIACRLAAFDLKEPVLGTRLDVTPRSYPDLESRLTRLEQRLLDAAEGQDWADAWRNASAYRKAAAQVAWARSTVGAPPIR